MFSKEYGSEKRIKFNSVCSVNMQGLETQTDIMTKLALQYQEIPKEWLGKTREANLGNNLNIY